MVNDVTGRLAGVNRHGEMICTDLYLYTGNILSGKMITWCKKILCNRCHVKLKCDVQCVGGKQIK